MYISHKMQKKGNVQEGSIMKTNQFGILNEWKKQWDQFFGGEFWSGLEPLFNNMQTQMNLYKGENELLVVLAIPGLENVENLELFAHYQTLEVKGKINLDFPGFELMEEGIFEGNFHREIQLPYSVREDRIEANYENGLLIIHLYRLIPDETKKKVTIKKVGK
jgi:HSP20 family protein